MLNYGLDEMPDSNNGRITLALVVQKLDGISGQLERVESNFRDIEIRQTRLEIAAGKRDSRIDGACKDLGDLEKKADSWSILNTIGVAIAGILGALGLTK